jgi:hypothetical protein
MPRILSIRYIDLFSIILILAIPSVCLSYNISRMENETFKTRSASERTDGRIYNPRPVLAIAPRELDLGAIGPGQDAQGLFTLKNVGVGSLNWSTDGPESWTLAEGKKLIATIEGNHADLKIYIKISSPEESGSGDHPNRFPCQVTFVLQDDKAMIISKKDLMPGLHREVIRLVSTGGNRSLFVRFRIIQQESEPMLMLEPTRIDFGTITPGQQVSKRVKLVNRGRNTLRWRAGIKDVGEGEDNSAQGLGRYISFQNEETAGKGVYTFAGRFKDVMEISGRWTEADGYPAADSANLSMKFRFSGTGIDVFFKKISEGAQWTAFIDDRPVGQETEAPLIKEQTVFHITDGIADGQHVLTLLVREASAVIEGVKVYGPHLIKWSPGWITVFPMNGTTISETDYVNITASTQTLIPGYYTEQLLFSSNGGEEIVELSLEVLLDNQLKTIDVYRYIRNADYLYTSNPQAEAKQLLVKRYIKEGIAFRLYSPDTPGTTAFYRWYNIHKGDHYYSYDRNGGGKNMEGYVFEGVIGNIATSRLSGSRELFRWFHPSKKCHFYTTDRNGEGRAKNGYRFEGIAGYVK